MSRKSPAFEAIGRWNYYEGGLTEEHKMEYQKFGSYPPDLQDSFTSRIWKKFMRPCSQRLESQKSNPEEEKKILKIMKLIRETAEKHFYKFKLYSR